MGSRGKDEEEEGEERCSMIASSHVTLARSIRKLPAPVKRRNRDVLMPPSPSLSSACTQAPLKLPRVMLR